MAGEPGARVVDAVVGIAEQTTASAREVALLNIPDDSIRDFRSCLQTLAEEWSYR